MPVQEFECQIARGQIGRYLNGENLSGEGLRQLGAHVAECAECKTFLDHRKATLQGMLGETAMPAQPSTRAVVDLNPSEALIAQIRARAVADEPAPAAAGKVKPVKPILTKPVIYCGALALVLVGMTYISRNPTGFLGPHAAQIVAANPPAAAAVSEAKTESAAKTPDSKSAEVKTPPVTETRPAGEAKVAPDAKSSTDGSGGSNSTGAGSAPVTPAPPESKAAQTQSEDSTETKPGIDPAGTKASSPISIGSEKATTTPTDSSAAATKATKQSKPVKAAKWRRRAKSVRRYGFLHLKSGTGAIHVYSHPN